MPESLSDERKFRRLRVEALNRLETPEITPELKEAREDFYRHLAELYPTPNSIELEEALAANKQKLEEEGKIEGGIRNDIYKLQLLAGSVAGIQQDNKLFSEIGATNSKELKDKLDVFQKIFDESMQDLASRQSLDIKALESIRSNTAKKLDISIKDLKGWTQNKNKKLDQSTSKKVGNLLSSCAELGKSWIKRDGNVKKYKEGVRQAISNLKDKKVRTGVKKISETSQSFAEQLISQGKTNVSEGGRGI